MTFLFWLFAFLLVYPLVIYPFVLIILQKINKYNSPHIHQLEENLPFVSILLSAYNEEKVIADKLNNFLELDYPKDKLEFIIISDESTDETDAIIKTYIEKENHTIERIRLIRQEPREGKTTALNKASTEAKGEILFFTDADSMLHKNAMRKIVSPFVDPNVGLVSGRSVYRDDNGNETAGSVYRQYEEWLKNYEGLLFGIAGADGGIYAMRKELYTKLPTKIINDLAHPIQVILANKKALAKTDAIISEPAEDDSNAFARQTRIMTQSWYVFFTYFKPLLENKCYGFLWQFFTHKILRWLAIVWLVFFTISAFFAEGIFPILGILGVIALITCAYLGEKAKIFGRISRLFMLQSLAGIYGLIRLWQGEMFVTWNPKS